MAYIKINWQDGESGGTPISSENLNKMDEQIYTNTEMSEQNTKDIDNMKIKIEDLTKSNEMKQEVILSGTSLPDTVVNGRVFLLYS